MTRYLADAMTFALPNSPSSFSRLAAIAVAAILSVVAAPVSASEGNDADEAAAEDSADDAARSEPRDALVALEGTWSATNSAKEARDRIDAQIDAVVSEMSFIKRPFARRRLTKVTEPCQTTSLTRLPDARIEIHCKGRNPAVAPLDGTPVQWTDRDGETFRLTQKVEEDRIVQTFRGEDGTRRNTYRREGDRMILDARLTSDQLPEPLTFRRTFERK